MYIWSPSKLNFCGEFHALELGQTLFGREKAGPMFTKKSKMLAQQE